MRFTPTTDQLDIRKAVKEFAEKEFTKEIALECDKTELFPYKLHKMAAELGFIGIHFPEQYGGGGFGTLENCLYVEEICRVDSGLGIALSLSDLASELIINHGSEEQKQKYLPKVASGDFISAVALTEPEHGSDITEMDTTAIAVKSGDEWEINGCKTLISNVSIAGFYIVLCQTIKEVSPTYRGQSLIIVDADTEGLEYSLFKDKLGCRASPTGELSFCNVHVPEENLLGILNKGFYHTLNFFNQSRVEIAAQGVGIAQGAFERAFNYAKERKAFGKPIITGFQAISHKLADMSIKIEAARLLTHKAAWLVDQGQPDPAISSMAKTNAGRVAVEVADEAIQVLGGAGYLAENEVERFYRDAKIIEIYEGTREIQKNTIVRFLLKRGIKN
ncbi:acyl-CoA dehydrogenase family protein [Candidatus Borrarchaeum sp.]|uniref:acyl-CoA dehydrogenase family protein n=1 Tax=Candidatus Borrarchaeum sp. TaxID=2846742 RepID=UPI00257D6634|nr:acyl-CoA dehydrogenase family protein [Candidatus Borrarchaeum sp.]